MLKAGIEYSIHKMIFLRMGDNVSNGINNLTLGLGINFKLNKNNLSADYGIDLQDNVGYIQAISLKMDF